MEADSPREPTDVELSYLEIDLELVDIWRVFEMVSQLQTNPEEREVVRGLIRAAFLSGRANSARATADELALIRSGRRDELPT